VHAIIHFVTVVSLVLAFPLVLFFLSFCIMVLKSYSEYLINLTRNSEQHIQHTLEIQSDHFVIMIYLLPLSFRLNKP
jgi:hypothetical protein